MMKKNTQLTLPGTATRTALILPKNMSFDDWVVAGKQLAHAERAVMWWLGDWWLAGERNYGDMVNQVSEFEMSYKTFAQAAWVSGSVERSLRRESLSWSHHKAVASLEPDQQVQMLEWAEAEGASVSKLCSEIRSRKGIEPTIYGTELVDDWITTEQAAEMLCVGAKALVRIEDRTIPRIEGREAAKAGKHGYLWWRTDIETLARIKKRAGLSLNVALRIMAAERPRNADFASLANNHR